MRTGRGPRQRVVASLGKLDQADVDGLRGGWDDLRWLLRGEAAPAKTAGLPGLDPTALSAPPAPRGERADVSGLRVERTRDFGESYLARSLWHRLKLDELLAALLPEGRESVGWAHTAALLTVARFCAQRSELGVAEHGYLLRTNCEETDPALLWKWYIQLTQAEAAFRTAKSDLGRRPVFHQKEDRVQAHILVCFLALALWRSLEQWMHAKGLGSCARQLVKEMAKIKSVDVLLPVLRGTRRTALRLRVVATPEPATAQLLAHLGLRLPKGPRIVADVVPKIAP